MTTKDFQPIHNVSSIKAPESLAKHIGVDWSLLKNISENINSHWRKGKTEKKQDGSLRITNSGTLILKSIHKKINRKILSKVYYPDYLYGGLKNNPDGTSRNHIANAKLHQGKRLIVSADIDGFFPSITESTIQNIWQCFFPFSPNVANLLTRLTSYQGKLPQGWGNSPYLAQLVFWKTEHILYQELLKQDIEYSRFIDDFTLSTNRTITKENLTQLFRGLATLCIQRGTKLKRKKCKVESKFRHQTINKLGVDSSKISISLKYRKNLRASIHRLNLNKNKLSPTEYESQKNSLQGKINYILKLHPHQANQFQVKLSNSLNK